MQASETRHGHPDGGAGRWAPGCAPRPTAAPAALAPARSAPLKQFFASVGVDSGCGRRAELTTDITIVQNTGVAAQQPGHRHVQVMPLLHSASLAPTCSHRGPAHPDCWGYILAPIVPCLLRPLRLLRLICIVIPSPSAAAWLGASVAQCRRRTQLDGSVCIQAATHRLDGES